MTHSLSENALPSVSAASSGDDLNKFLSRESQFTELPNSDALRCSKFKGR
jgi:hypothetical protein